jgi:hypothetical protein
MDDKHLVIQRRNFYVKPLTEDELDKISQQLQALIVAGASNQFIDKLQETYSEFIYKSFRGKNFKLLSGEK